MNRYHSTLFAVIGLHKLTITNCNIKSCNAIYELITDELSKNMDSYDEREHGLLTDYMEFLDVKLKERK